MKFSEYLASYITPQMTLLEKFNAMIKWIEESPKLYFHEIHLRNLSTNERKELSFIDTLDKEYTVLELSGLNFFNKKITTKINHQPVIYFTYEGNNRLFFYTGTNLASSSILISSNSWTIENQTCSAYEN